MCGIGGVIDLKGRPIGGLDAGLAVINRLLAHRGPDDEGTWVSPRREAGLAHRRLTIIDLSDAAGQPMAAPNDTVLVHNGEVYNYLELRERLGEGWRFRTRSDTETILAAYDRWGTECPRELRGMFAFALWDQRRRRLFCARDRFGIKPFYYAVIGDRFVFASEIKALIPFLAEVETDDAVLAEYFTFQYPLGEATLFRGVRQLMPGHALVVEGGRVTVSRYWDVHYDIDFDHTPSYFHRRLAELVDDSIRVHLRSDVPVGSYLSGGIDSSLIAILASRFDPANADAFHGKFTCHPGYDESAYAETAAASAGKTLHQVDITAGDFIDNFERVVYHLDHPIAGPGSFPQFMVAKLAAERVKVVLGGQGGDEIFGGYARYLIAYFEQCIKAAIEGTYKDGHFVVTAESIIGNLGVLREYRPLMRTFWREGLFEPLDRRYFRLIDRSADMADEVRWERFDRDAVFESFLAIFNSSRNVRKEAYFDSMTHFDFKCLLPALLHVEDRMSMAHGLESRVPFLDHALIEHLATVPAMVKFKDGQMKFMLKSVYEGVLPASIMERRDKMGFPVPLSEWLQNGLRDYVFDLFTSEAARTRPYLNAPAVLRALETTGRFSRKAWGLMCLEVWQRLFHDRAGEYRALLSEPPGSRARAVV